MTPKKKPLKGKKVKSGKGKKEAKQEPNKAHRECDMETVKAGAALWEARLDVTEQSRVHYREAARRLARANEELTNQQYRAEKDTLEIVSLLKRRDAEKEEKVVAEVVLKIMKLEDQLKSQTELANEEREKLVAEYTAQINELVEMFKKRSDDFEMIQAGLKTIKEFGEKKAQMEVELSSIKESMNVADKNHKEHLGRLETKFFSEKVRLEKEAEQRLAQLAERAHNEAIVKLDDASRSVFKENVRLNEALNYHTKEVEDLKKRTVSLAQENASMSLDKATDGLMIRKNAAQTKAYREEIRELKAKVASLERAAERTAGEVEREKEELRQEALARSRDGLEELRRLEKLLDVRQREIRRLKRLASSVVRQRTEVEGFFHEALFQVKQNIQASRLLYRDQAQKAYQVRMRDARAGRQKYPLIRTFNKTPHSTNCVYSDLEEAEKWTNVQSDHVDITDLTWEQKEKVLRLLFAKMNGQKARNFSHTLALSASAEESDAAAGVTEDLSPMTFITQAAVSHLPSDPHGLPDIHTA